MVSYCGACYARKRYCRKCRTYHCLCSWSTCKRAARLKEGAALEDKNREIARLKEGR